MALIDFNGEGRWSRDAILDRYARFASEEGIVPRDLHPRESETRDHRWVYPVMDQVVEGIKAGDVACVRLGIEFIEEDAKFPFGRILKSNTARALRRANLSEAQGRQIKCRVFEMLRAGKVHHEFHEYAKLVKKIGFQLSEIGDVPGTSERVIRFRKYFEAAARDASIRRG